jgi:hypothetical protein
VEGEAYGSEDAMTNVELLEPISLRLKTEDGRIVELEIPTLEKGWIKGIVPADQQ